MRLRLKSVRLLPTRARTGAVGALAGVTMLLSAMTPFAPSAGALGSTNPGAALVSAPDGNGYSVFSSSGASYDYGSSHAPGAAAGSVDPASAPVVGAAVVPHGTGSWLALRDGTVVATGGAPSFGSFADRAVRPTVAAIAATPTGRGYWLVTEGGAVTGFGDAPFLGSQDLGSAITGIAATPSGHGYWLSSAGGNVAAFGDAVDLGSPAAAAAAAHAPAPPTAVTVLSSRTGQGYLVVGVDGTTWAYGDYPNPGSLAGMHLRSPVVDATGFSSDAGVWLLTLDGGVIALEAPFLGSVADEKNPKPKSVTAPYYLGGAPTVDGAAGGLVAIPCSGADGMVVTSVLLARQVHDVLDAANRDGIPLCATSSFRNAVQQVNLRQQYCSAVYDPNAACSRPVALPGRSRHEQGLAVDFSTTPAGFAWLGTHAPALGLTHLHGFAPGVEPWHYSIDGG